MNDTPMVSAMDTLFTGLMPHERTSMAPANLRTYYDYILLSYALLCKYYNLKFSQINNPSRFYLKKDYSSVKFVSNYT